jgi:hypothetical protein
MCALDAYQGDRHILKTQYAPVAMARVYVLWVTEK